MISLTSPGPIKETLKSNGYDLFEEWERVRLAEVHSAILLKHLASNFLSPNGYVCFNGDMKVFQEKTSFNEPLLQQISKCTIQKLGLDLATDRMDEELIYDNACVNILLHEQLITDRDRKVPSELKIYNRKL